MDGVLVVFDTWRCFPEQFLKWTTGWWAVGVGREPWCPAKSKREGKWWARCNHLGLEFCSVSFYIVPPNKPSNISTEELLFLGWVKTGSLWCWNVGTNKFHLHLSFPVFSSPTWRDQALFLQEWYFLLQPQTLFWWIYANFFLMWKDNL